jgi:hypothetical protein
LNLRRFMKSALCIGMAVILPAMTLSCASGASSDPRTAALASGQGEDFVTFRVVDVMIAPTRLDGKPWDRGTGFEDPSIRDRIVTGMNRALNAKGAYDAASVALGRLGDAWGRPDVGGSASVDPGDGKQETRSLEGEKNSLTPRFVARWEHIPLTHWTTVRMYFVDKDAVGSGDIGAVVLSPLDLAAALKENGAVHHLRVDDQTNGQILFVGISVKSEH